ncbi:NfeD family protein, partial [Bacteroidota bacterium]
IPGISVAGIGGFILISGGVYIAFHYFGMRIGFIVLSTNLTATIILLYFAFRAKTWKNIGLKSEINSKFETFDKDEIKIGDTGKTISRLAPMGKVMVNDVICEAKSRIGFVDENTEIEVIEIENTNIIVKPKN